MRTRGLWIGTVLLVLLAGGIWWSNKSEEARAKRPPADAPPKIIDMPEDQLRKVEIRRAAGETTVLENKSGKWEITAPKPFAVDPQPSSSLISSLCSLTSDRIVEQKASDLSPYGLAKPGVEVVLTKKDGKSLRLLLGDETPTGNDCFASLQGDPRVFTVYSYVKSAIDKNSNDLRDKRLLTFDSDKLIRVELAAKGQNLEFGKNNQNEWQILKPRPLRADGGQVEELIRRLKDAKMDLSVSAEDAKKAAAGFASGTQVALAKVTDAAGTQQLQLRKDKDKNYYGKSSAVEGVYKVPADIGEGLDKGLDDFRNKKVFDFGWNDPTKLDVRDGAKQTSYQKSGEKWMSGGKQMDSTAIQTVIDKLRDLAASKFPDKGFAAPELEFTVTSNDGKRAEKVALSKSGNDWLARRENEPTLYQLDAKVVEELQKAIAGVKEAAPPPKK
ncbi:MAG: DUF4340 domain-containing protein [Bryobacteraceae bacterium]|jgi:hypothetical protein